MVSVKNKMSFNKYFCKIPNKKRRKNFLGPPEVEEIFLRGILHKNFSKNGENLSEKIWVSSKLEFFCNSMCKSSK